MRMKMKRMKKMKIKFLIFINFFFDMKYFFYKKEANLYICKSFWKNNSIIKLKLIIKIFLIGIY